MATKLIDCHSHTAYSGHGQGNIAQAVHRAQELGLAVYAQTEHLTLPQELDPNREDSMSTEDAMNYLTELRTERERLLREGSAMELVVGIEADWLTGRAAQLEELCRPYDYVVASVHFADGLPIDNDENMTLWEHLGVDGVWERYFELVEEMLRNCRCIHALAHPDLPKVFGMRPSFDIRDAFGDIFNLARERDLLIELNTAGWRKEAQEQYPAFDLLKLAHDIGLCPTVGADAHKSSDIAAGVQEAYALLYDAGYRYVYHPRQNTAFCGEFGCLELV